MNLFVFSTLWLQWTSIMHIFLEEWDSYCREDFAWTLSL